ncbi:MAG TPA: hypothetical protein VFQ39_18400 [Longimicrobium sp.]|nr:hypothetical protein [Longimicrobium sp.]
MYRHCIYCSADLGANESIEAFPVGRQLAFDAAKGRLWAVCPRCSRWNLAPLEERWEAVESAEKLFVDTRLRVQSENVGLAKLRDGTKLVRIGAAVPREVAAWRYGRQLVTRHRGRVIAGAALAGVAGIAVLGLAVVAVAAIAPLFFELAVASRDRRRGDRVMHVIHGWGPGGVPLVLRGRHLYGVRPRVEDDGALALEMALAAPGSAPDTPPLVLRGPQARATLERMLTIANQAGAKQDTVDAAIDLLVASGDAGELARGYARSGAYLPLKPMGLDGAMLGLRKKRPGWEPELLPITGGFRTLEIPQALALEMAVHEETERRAMEGELALLESAWREAEALAEIADRLAGGDAPLPLADPTR